MLALTSDIRTPFHAIPAGVKLGLLAVTTVGLFQTDSPLILLAVAASTALVYCACGRVFALSGAKMLRPLALVIGLIVLWSVVTGNAAGGFVVALRLLTAVAWANLVTMTTRVDDMIAIFMRVLAPLEKFGFPVKSLAFAIALVIRFVPVMGERTAALVQAWRARSGSKHMWRIVVPLVFGMLDDADHVSDALRARGGLDGEYHL